ncbi:MAG: hypothetical protein ACOY0T_32675 [Myxococcota bacterium]
MSITPPPAAVEELTLTCLEYVKRALGVALDFSPETLPLLDHYATIARAEIEANPALAAIIAPAVGAYFGEVVRARLDGFWRVPSQNFHDWSVCSRVTYLAVNPIGVAYDAIYGNTEHDGPRSALRIAPEDREYLDRRLATLPPVPEDEFYLFSTRFEVLEVATEALAAKMEEEGYGGTEYSPDDYGVDYGMN